MTRIPVPHFRIRRYRKGRPVITLGANNWLYPLSSRSDYEFPLTDGSTMPDTSPQSLSAVAANCSAHGPWQVHNNRVNGKVQKGDRIWFYYGRADGDRGVVAVATVTGMDPCEGVTFFWEQSGTAQLATNPVPASFIRQYVPSPRTPLVALDQHPHLIESLVTASGLESQVLV